MTSMTITSITLPASIVHQVLSTHLNAQFLRIPHTVTGVELLDDSFIVTLEPAPADSAGDATWTYPERVVTMTAPLVEYRTDTPANGNGHHDMVGADLRVGPDPTPEEIAPAASSAEAPKRHRISGLTDEIRAEVIRLHQLGGLSGKEIAARAGVGYSTAFRVVKEWKAQQPAAADGAA